MELKEFHCKICGGTLRMLDKGIYQCENNSSHQFREQSITKQREELLSQLGEALDKRKEELIANARYNLWDAVHEKYIDSEKVIGYCRELKKLLPEDFQANFYEVATFGTITELNEFLDDLDVGKYASYMDGVLDYLTGNITYENLPSLRYLIERAFTGEIRDKYNTICDENEELIKRGVYDETLPRDVFLAYKSQDIKIVNELCNYLEQQGLKCFLSSRNLKHGIGAKNLYEERLKRAIDHCKVLVFVSTNLSRTVGDARHLELVYIRNQDKENAPAQYKHNYSNIPKAYKMPRVEYLGEPYKKGEANEDFAREFFRGYQYRESYEAVYKAVEEYLDEISEENATGDIKYCKDCGMKTTARTKFCGECGKSEFVATHKEFLKHKEEEIKKAAAEKLEAERQRLRKELEEEFNRKQRELQEQFARKQQEVEEEKKRLEEEFARRQRELEEEKKKFEEEKLKHQQAKNSNSSISLVDNDYPTLDNYDRGEFKIEGSELKKYLGKGGDVKIPSGTTAIGKKVFQNVKGLKNITIPDSVTSIGGLAFDNCCGLSSITIPKNVKDISGSAFWDCSGLTSITVDGRNPNYHSAGNCLIETASKTLMAGCKNSFIPDDGSVTSIRAAFYGCSGLTSITIPISVKAIGSFAFNGCSGLTSISIPNNVTSIDSWAFSDCSSLSSITIPNGVTSIDTSAFWGCCGLTNITIPNSVESIGNNTFYDCTNLKVVSMPSELKSFIDIAFGAEKDHIKFNFT